MLACHYPCRLLLTDEFTGTQASKPEGSKDSQAYPVQVGWAALSCVHHCLDRELTCSSGTYNHNEVFWGGSAVISACMFCESPYLAHVPFGASDS